MVPFNPDAEPVAESTADRIRVATAVGALAFVALGTAIEVGETVRELVSLVASN